MKIKLNPPLDGFKARRKAIVDEEAEAFRMQYLTPGAGQAMVYIVKEQEARAIRSNAGGDVPHLAAEARARGISVHDMAQLVISKADGWRELSAAIEGQRIAAKVAIESAKTVGDVVEASNVDWEAV